jgi:hypothetical protein
VHDHGTDGHSVFVGGTDSKIHLYDLRRPALAPVWYTSTPVTLYATQLLTPAPRFGSSRSAIADSGVGTITHLDHHGVDTLLVSGSQS